MITVFASLALLQAASSPAAEGTTTPPPPAPACDTPAHAAFDFWVGEWDVYARGSDSQVARSTIERLYTGCAIRENWNPLRGGPGGSLNSLDPGTGRWHQTWIGSSPGRVEFIGGPVDGKMVLTGYWAGVGPQGEDGLIRMTYTPNVDGPETRSVRQHGELSLDHGLSWSDSFDFIYRPHKEASE